MKKKKYIKPEMMVVRMETQDILAGSFIKKAKAEDYNEEAVDNYRELDGSIWAD
ncbi:hypothetical protein [Prevotella merdae]|uniref:hypothetical protein n=1 Tax=Prevotella merdae TaxID=2079531 RepID=UPI00356999A5